ncbi:MAG: YdeI/OmpD-associated family protein [Bacteroidetes bacterium]|nr:YdeI/OmpD-associated family protein [Bacteroidota bacterium]
MSPKVDFFFTKNHKWQPEIEHLREIVLSLPLEEELKWGCPCYFSAHGKIVLIHVFKEYCALLFFKGALMADGDQLLVQQTENVQSARQLRFKNLDEIIQKEKRIKDYLCEAIKIEKAGLKVVMKKTTEFKIPEELEHFFQQEPDFKKAFEALTPGRQRGYLLHFSAPKQEKTRISRIEKFKESIFQGKGWNDK